MPRRPVGHKPVVKKTPHRDNHMPIDLTRELTAELHQTATKVADVGEMIDRLPQAERIVAALMELQGAVTAVLAEQVNR